MYVIIFSHCSLTFFIIDTRVSAVNEKNAKSTYVDEMISNPELKTGALCAQRVCTHYCAMMKYKYVNATRSGKM